MTVFLEPKEVETMPGTDAKHSETDMARTLTVLAHELRAPLSAIEYAAATLRDRTDAVAIHETRETIHRQVRQMSALLDYFTEGWLIGRGGITPMRYAEIRRVDLRDVVRDGVDAVRPQRPVIVLGDRVRLVQVVVNLMTNAAKFTPSPGEVHLILTHEARRATLRVRDTGWGIPAAMRGRIFKPFTRLHSAAGDGPPGLGIGLAVVRSTVAAHGGIVTVYSEGRGRGSEFSVRLPIATTVKGSAA